MTIAQEVTTLRSQLPDTEPMRTFERDRRRLAASTAPTIATGRALPDPTLLDAHGEPTTLSAVTSPGRPAVLVFYRGAWCPYCNITLRVYEAELAPELARRDVALVAISPQKPDGSLTMAETNALSFPVLSDIESVLTGELGIAVESPAEVRAAQRELGLDVTEVNGAGSSMLPLPTVVIVDGESTIRWADVRPDYTSRTEPQEVLAALDRLSG